VLHLVEKCARADSRCAIWIAESAITRRYPGFKHKQQAGEMATRVPCSPAGLPATCMNVVSSIMVSRWISALLLVVLLALGSLDCFAQPELTPMRDTGCCHHAPCPKMPGSPANSACSIEPPNPGGATLPQPSRAADPVVLIPVACVVSDPAASPASRESDAFHQPDYPPPDLFLKNSSLLI
jgi:hypothetical protein